MSQLTSSDIFTDLYAHHAMHEGLLKDEARTDVFMKAIDAVVKDKIVLDIGCGLGIFSLFAAQAGARHVYAVDSSAIIEQTREIVAANNMQENITLIRGKIEEIDLPVENVDVILCEWMGSLVVHSSLIESVIFARDKWLSKDDGVILPDIAELFVLGIEDEAYKKEKIHWWGNVYGFNMKPMAEKAILEPYMDYVARDHIITNACSVKVFDMNTITKDEIYLKDVKFSIKTNVEEYIHAVVFYFDVSFSAAKMSFSTGPFVDYYTHWRPSIFYLHDFIYAGEGETLSGTISMKPNDNPPKTLSVDIEYKFKGWYQTYDDKSSYILNWK